MYLIKDAAAKLGTNANTLRYYEKIGILEHINRDKNGIRQYTEHDLEQANLLLILRKMGMSLKQIKQVLPKDGANAPIEKQIKFRESLYTLLEQLNEQNKQIEIEKQLVNEKIARVSKNINSNKIYNK